MDRCAREMLPVNIKPADIFSIMADKAQDNEKKKRNSWQPVYVTLTKGGQNL